MRRAVVVVILLVSLAGVALSRAEEQPAIAAEKAAGRKTPGQEPRPADEEAADPSPVWPLPFRPSEEVGADSQISFPTDI